MLITIMTTYKTVAFILFLISIPLGLTAQYGALEWAGQLETDSTFYIGDIHVDNSGNFYLTGSFTGNVDFDPSSGNSILTSIGRMDIFVAKYDSKGSQKALYPLHSI